MARGQKPERGDLSQNEGGLMTYEIKNFHGNNGEFAKNAEIWRNGKHIANVGVGLDSEVQVFVLNGENGFDVERDICRHVGTGNINGAIGDLIWDRDKSTDKAAA
jgi:hypothetical protein